MTDRETYTVDVAGVTRELPLFEVAPGVRIAILNILGDTELVRAAADALADRIGELDADVLVTAETKSIPLVHELSTRLDLPYVVLRKQYRPYMGDALAVETLSITTGAPQTPYLDEKDRVLLACGCGEEHDGLVSHDELDWAPLGLQGGVFLNLMTAHLDSIEEELCDLAARRIQAGEWPWSFFCYPEDKPRPVFPSAFFL